jgi:dTDP-4-amino-4,6-dideoxygalactose transaminase
VTEKRDIPFGRPWITDEDRKAVLRVLSGHILTHGPECKAFEADFAAFMGAGAHCVSVSSCMAALHLAYLHLGLGPGDDVIAPALTHVAAVHAIEWVGARPVFVDCDPSTGNVTAGHIEASLTPATKAISLVHFAGIPCDMTAIMALAERRRLKVIEDCAIALGARWRGIHVGLFGDMGTFSFYPVKHITTGEGGMFATRHRVVADSVGRLRAFGVDRTHGERSIPGFYEVPSLGLNYRMSEMQAALGRTQIARIEENLARRRENFRVLRGALAERTDVQILDAQSSDARNSHYCLVAVLQGALARSRNDVIARLNALSVGTSIYYPQPVPRMLYYRNKYGFDPNRYPNATAISDRSIALPVGQHLSGDDMHYVATAMASVLKEVAA